MRQRQKQTDAAPNPRSDQIDAVVADTVHRRLGGERVEDIAVVDAHQQLMPELGERLRSMRDIERAATVARRVASAADPSDGAEEREFLERFLPGYRVLCPIYYGGQGVVYRAVQIAARRHVAIKLLIDGPLATQRSRSRFEREVEIISRLDHPNIVTLHDSGVIQRRYYFVMEFVEGVPIDDHVLVDDLTVRDVVALFVVVCRAVAYAHQRGVIHRDLKPTNILVDVEGSPRVLDFGLAKDCLASDPDGGDPLTQVGERLGTLAFASPEQTADSGGEADVRSDVYSLGVVLFKLLSGTSPYSTEGDVAEVSRRIRTQEPLRLRAALGSETAEPRRGQAAINDDLERVIGKALCKEPDRRYYSAGAFADDLERYLRGEAVDAKAASRWYVARKTLRRYRVAVSIAAMLFLVLGGSTVAIGVMWRHARLQRDHAREVARLAHSMFEKVVGEIDDRIASLAGGMAVREELISYLSQELPQLLSLVESDPSMDDLRAAIYEKQGDIAQSLGRNPDAVAHYGRFLALTAHGTAQEWSESEVERIARAHRKLGMVSTDFEPHFREAIRLGLAAPVPGHALALERCRAHMEFEDRFFAAGRYPEAAEQITRAMESLESLKHGTLDSREIEVTLARAHSMQGNVLEYLGDLDGALVARQSAYELRRELSRRDPANAALRHAFMLSSYWLGRQHQEAGEYRISVAMLNTAASAGEYLTIADPSMLVWKRDLTSVYGLLVRLHLALGERPSADARARAATVLAAELVERAPAEVEHRRLSAYVQALSAQVAASHDRSLAESLFDRASAIRRTLVDENPGEPRYLSDLADDYETRAVAAQLWGDAPTAIELLQKSASLRERLHLFQPEVTSQTLDLVKIQIVLADACLRAGTPDDCQMAEDLVRRASDLLGELSRAKTTRKYDFCRQRVESLREALQRRHENEQP